MTGLRHVHACSGPVSTPHYSSTSPSPPPACLLALLKPGPATCCPVGQLWTFWASPSTAFLPLPRCGQASQGHAGRLFALSPYFWVMWLSRHAPPISIYAWLGTPPPPALPSALPGSFMNLKSLFEGLSWRVHLRVCPWPKDGLLWRKRGRLSSWTNHAALGRVHMEL